MKFQNIYIYMYTCIYTSLIKHTYSLLLLADYKKGKNLSSIVFFVEFQLIKHSSTADVLKYACKLRAEEGTCCFVDFCWMMREVRGSQQQPNLSSPTKSPCGCWTNWMKLMPSMEFGRRIISGTWVQRPSSHSINESQWVLFSKKKMEVMTYYYVFLMFLRYCFQFSSIQTASFPFSSGWASSKIDLIFLGFLPKNDSIFGVLWNCAEWNFRNTEYGTRNSFFEIF